MVYSVIHHLRHPLTYEDGTVITKKQFLYSLGIIFAQSVFTAWAAWPNSWSSNNPAIFFIGTCTVFTFYACTALFKTYAYTGNHTSQDSASRKQPPNSEDTPETQEETALFSQQITQIGAKLGEFQGDFKTILAKVKGAIALKNQTTGSVEQAKTGNTNLLSMPSSKLVETFEKCVTIDHLLNHVQKQIVEIQPMILNFEANKAS